MRQQGLETDHHHLTQYKYLLFGKRYKIIEEIDLEQVYIKFHNGIEMYVFRGMLNVENNKQQNRI